MKRPHVPELGASTPRRGNSFSAALGRWALRVWSWRIAGAIPDVPKAVIIVAPHTSNWDFPLGVAVMFAFGLRTHFLGKHTLFGGILGPVMRWLGGVPVNRQAAGGVVGDAVALFNGNDQLILALAPEGTRSDVSRWKTGFYRIAVQAEVPIVLVALDWGRRIVRINPVFEPTGDLDRDLCELRQLCAEATGRRAS